MVANRTQRPKLKKRQKLTTHYLDFYIEKVPRNTDLYKIILDKQILLTVVNIDVGQLEENIEPLICVSIKNKNKDINVRKVLKKGPNEISIYHFAYKGDEITLDFEDVDTVYKNISEISGHISYRA